MDESIQDLTSQLREAEMKFVRKIGTLKYLKHLEKNKQLENCPICVQQPEHKVIFKGLILNQKGKMLIPFVDEKNMFIFVVFVF